MNDMVLGRSRASSLHDRLLTLCLRQHEHAIGGNPERQRSMRCAWVIAGGNDFCGRQLDLIVEVADVPCSTEAGAVAVGRVRASCVVCGQPPGDENVPDCDDVQWSAEP